MPSKKQRRRREKTFRHEYETVLLDADGNELPVDPDALRAEREEKRAARAKPAAKKTTASGRPLREPALPTWQRALRKGGAMGAVMMLVMYYFERSQPVGARLMLGLVYGVMFIPLTYLLDRTAYRSFQKRQARKTS